jgi:pSer/pThr/pTyr-binding forkhead associated (FHA) protein
LTSLGKGILPSGFVWELHCKDATLGRHIANDFVIPSNLIAREQLRFTYTRGGFFVEDLEGQNRCYVGETPIVGQTAIAEGQVIRIGDEEFQYNFCGDDAIEISGPQASPLAAHLQLSLGILSEFHTSLNLKEVLDNALDAVLRLTRTSRAYAFLIEAADDGNAELMEAASRAAGGKVLGSEDTSGDYTISQSVIQKVLSGDGSVFIEDAAEEQVSTETIVRFKLKSIACLPLIAYDYTTGRKQVIGVLYADSFMPSGALPEHCRPTLQMLSQIVAATIAKWQNYGKMEESFGNFDRSIKGISKDLAYVSDQMQDLEGKVTEGRGISRVSDKELGLELNAMLSRIRTVQAQLQRVTLLRR